MTSKEPIFKLHNFQKSFGEKVVHRSVSFDLFKGEVVSLIGGSGSGKSVLLRSMIGLEQADQGSVYFKGRDVTHLSEEQWNEVRRKVAYAFQGGALFDSMSVEENLLYPLDAHTKMSRAEKQKKVDETLELLGLEGTNDLSPLQLSGGMLKRAGLARALILDPEVILYDEPTAGLDPFNTRNIQEIISNLKRRGTGGILVTHDMPTSFATCERLLLLMNGRIEVEGTVSQLKEENPLIRAFITGEVAYGKA